MAGCLDNVRMPSLFENLNLSERRNKLASITAGILVRFTPLYYTLHPISLISQSPNRCSFLLSFQFFSGWWIAIDAAVVYWDKRDIRDVFHICGVFGTLSMFMYASCCFKPDLI